VATPQLRQLRYFVAVAEELHFGRAAERLYIAQPALSQTIARLEDELGVRLLRRDSRHVALTDAGKVFLEPARATLDAAERAVDAARGADGVSGGTVELGFSPLVRFSILGAVVRSFITRHPASRINSREMMSGLLHGALERGEISVALTTYPPPRAGVRTETIARERLVVIGSPRGRLAGRTSVRLAELDGETLFLWPRDLSPGLFDHIVATCRSAGYEPRVEEPLPESSGDGEYLMDVAGISLSGASWAARGVPGVLFVPVEDEAAEIELTVAWREDAPPVAKRFVEVALAVAAEKDWLREPIALGS
jgi:DNA-binding transcriptional LysR family regulator